MPQTLSDKVWERHVVHVALYGPAPGRAPA